LSRNLNREENLRAAELVIGLPAVQLREGVAYEFNWLLENNNSLSVEGCYNLLCGLHNSAEYGEDFMAAAHRWRETLVPSTICMCGWRLLQDRLPTRVSRIMEERGYSRCASTI
jgi:hypothetical protein